MIRGGIRRSSRRLLGVAVIGLLGGAAIVGAAPAPPASASVMDAVSFSRDGVHFAARAQGALFAGLGPIVPGQRETARLWVRNDGSSPLVIRVNATDVSVDDGDYGRALSLRATTGTQSTAEPMTFSTTESCFMLLGEQYLQPGASMPITFRLAMADVGGAIAQSSTAAATLTVGLRDATSPWLDDAECDGDGAHLPVLVDPDPEPTTPPSSDPSPSATPDPTASVEPTPLPAPAGAAGGPFGPSGDSLSSTGTDALTWLSASVALIAGGGLALLLPYRSRRRRNP
ncbi:MULTISPECIES: hypothetical protein [unclassified Leifsonia]|uniref:hypothetical protein n=1 Tax=unclassified Leifsonia TaxID=2663824 RepID=UPI0006F36A66|nr:MULTISPECIES: hypothetical protein [unclassified Leifsonia]KQX05304.1 hypothetical protein ASC59_14160 [Leifsonia sp. Root1293]KRA08937.1 hypothetical protein ASD61_14160 [Leifsonia sp. Root60]